MRHTLITRRVATGLTEPRLAAPSGGGRRAATGELIRSAPREFRSGFGRQDADADVAAWAVGAPGARHGKDQIESLIECRECGAERTHATELTDEGRFRFTCNDFGTSLSP